MDLHGEMAHLRSLFFADKTYDYIIATKGLRASHRIQDGLMQPAHTLRIGIATPMANPTVEPELRALFPDRVNMLVTRSVAKGDSRSRLVTYFERLGESLETFGGLKLDAFGFACTASSYLLEPGRETERCAELSDRFGYPVITASRAIEASLRLRHAERLLIASPYPAWIAEACSAFWTRRGFDVVASASAAAAMTDTREIYELDPQTACDRFINELAPARSLARPDALLVTGTGLPTLTLLPALERALDLPVLTSNQCLATACLNAAEC